MVWFFFWLFFGFDSPASHPRISHEERDFIESSIDDDKIVQEKSEVLNFCSGICILHCIK